MVTNDNNNKIFYKELRSLFEMWYKNEISDTNIPKAKEIKSNFRKIFKIVDKIYINGYIGAGVIGIKLDDSLFKNN